jgi:hypothetical protein
MKAQRIGRRTKEKKMKSVVFAIACATLTAVVTPAFAGAVNGVDIATAKYTSTKCQVPADPGLLVTAIKSRKALSNAATAHNEYNDLLQKYQDCRIQELNADQQALFTQIKAEVEPLVAKSNATSAALMEKNKTIK